MGLLGLLTLPVTGPARAGWWVLEQITASAEDELYDEGRIRQQMRALAAEVDAGRISEREHAEAEEVLLGRLIEARARRQQAQEEP